MLGYTPYELGEYIRLHKNWNNVKNNKWHLDHIFPIKAFLDYGITDLKIINSLDNLQPILDKDNFIKNDKYDRVKFESWLNTKNDQK